MAGRAEKRLATLLNSCNAGNILDAARSDITTRCVQDGAGEWRREVAVCDSLCDSVGSVV